MSECSVRVILRVWIAILLTPVADIARAQSATTGAIAGAVRDTTGAVLPGVGVEAASPALIEKVRSAVTDDQGQYKIIDLRPGTYTVTFTLAGFSTVKREGLELNTGVTLPVNGEMKVGNVEETITVAGATPVVDVQNVRTQNVLTREVLDAVPTSKNFQAFAALTLGASMTSLGAGDVGGTKGETMIALSIHGAGAGLTSADGMLVTTAHNSVAIHRYQYNQLQVQEIVMETSGASAEYQSGGLNVNMVPKDGGNTLAGTFNADYMNRHLQGNNLTDGLRARGLTNTSVTRKIYDIGGGLGGPIKKNRLWFFTAHRAWGSEEERAGLYFNKTQDTLFYTPDLSRPAYYDKWVRDSGIRLTWQATAQQKIALSVNLQDFCWCYSFQPGAPATLLAPEATYHYRIRPDNLMQAKWSYPATNRLLVEAGATMRIDKQLAERAEPTGNARPVEELSTGLRYGSLFNPSVSSRDNYGNHGPQNGFNTRVAFTYVTGSHAFKSGITTMSGVTTIAGEPLYNVRYTFRDQVPVGLTQGAFPHYQQGTLKLDLGAFAQDQWTIRKLTLNLGLRFEYLNAYNAAQTRPGGEFVPEFSFAPVYNVPNWKDFAPRLGAAYDLFGNGKTAFKASLGRFMVLQTTGIANSTNPAGAIAATTTRTWNDTNRNFVPDCNLQDKGGNGECGPMDNQRFGTILSATQYAKDVTEGWGVRPFIWQASAALQQELRPGVALSVGYFRTWYGNFQVTDNRAVTPADFSPYCISAPADARLPDGGGYQVCGLYDVTPAKFGQVDNLVSQASHFGERRQVFNGVDVGINGRLGRGLRLAGGISVGNTLTDSCASADAPPQFCRTSATQSEVKLSGSYQLPWRLQVSATLQNLQGNSLSATYAATNAEIAPSLGRNLAACGTRVPCTATVTVSLMDPSSQFEDRYTLLDVRLNKTIAVGRTRVQPRVDVYNLFNAAAPINQTTRYGPSFRTPIEIVAARFVKFGVQVDF